MKRLTSLMLAVFMVVTMVSASLLTVSAAETTSVSLSAPAEVEFTGDAVEDSFQVEANLNLADGLTAIAGYEVKLTWDPACLTLLETVFSGEGITDQKPGEGSLTLAAVNATDVLSGRLFYVSFAPIAEGNTTVSVEVLSIATSTGLIDAEGSEVAITAAKPVVIYETPEEIVNAAYELENGEYLSDGYKYALTGEIISFESVYSEQYKNVSPIIAVEGVDGKPILCFRMKGEGADVIKIGDTITVTGKIKNYNGKIEFDSGCTLDSYVPGEPEVIIYDTPEAILNAAYQLDTGATLSAGHLYELTGVITSVDTEYSEQYGNVTVTIQVGDMADKPMKCFRMKGEGADIIKVGDTITVKGVIKNYNGTVEFDAGCTLEAYTQAPGHNHNYVEEITVQPTLSTEGSATYTCECGESYTEAIPAVKVQPNELVALPEGALVLDYAGYKHDSFHCIIAGDNLTVNDLTALGNNGAGKDMNYFYIIVVDADGVVADSWFDLGRPNAVKSDVVCPAGGYIIGFNGNKENYAELAKIEKGAKITLYNVDVEALRGVAGNVTVENAGFTYKNPAKIYETAEDIINAAYELENGEYLSDGHKYTLTGEILSVDTVYNPNYSNVTVTMTVEGKNIQCYRMKGEGADVIKIGDTITVTGKIKNYNGTIEFDTGCTLESYVPGTPEFVIYETPEEILQEAYKLADGAVLSGGHKYELTGVILSIDTAYDEKYGNISVTIQVGNMSEMPIQCFRLAGEGAAELQVGDTITAKGEIKNYHGKIEFNTCELLNVVKKPSFAFGDVDGNGKPAMADYFKLKSYLLGKNDSFDDGMLERSDIDGNGKVNKQDYFKLKSFLLGKWDPNA